MGTAVFLAAGVMAFGAGCLARSRYERDCLVTEEYRIASEKIHGQGKTIVFLTDLHNKEFGKTGKKFHNWCSNKTSRKRNEIDVEE